LFAWINPRIIAAVHAKAATWKALFSAGKAALALFPAAGTVAEIASAVSDIWDSLGIYREHGEHKNMAESIAKSEEKSIEKVLTTFAPLLDHARRSAEIADDPASQSLLSKSARAG
jgi:hypothetical protein